MPVIMEEVESGEVEVNKTCRCVSLFRELQTELVATLSKGDSKYPNQSVQRETSRKCELIDRFLANDPKREKIYSKELNIMDRRMDEVEKLDANLNHLP
jgi:hypothetical protein